MTHSAGAADDSIAAGYGIREITPPSGTPFGGFAIERLQGASGVHDPLFATAVVIEAGGTRIALVSCDLQLIAPHVVGVAQAAIQSRCSIESAAVMIHATHVHSAPGGDAAEATIPGLDSYFSTPETEAIVVSGIIDAVEDACDDLVPATVLGVSAGIAGIGDSRHRSLSGPQVATLLRLERTGVAPILIVNHGCHASVLGPDNTLLSADYPGVLRREAAVRGERLLFLNGAAGDISTRTTRRAQSFDEMERLGLALDVQLVAVARQARTLNAAIPAMRNAQVQVPARPIDRAALAAAEAGAEQQLRGAEGGAREAAEQAVRRGRFRRERLGRFDGAPIAVALQAFAVGELCVLGVGGELFSDLGAAVVAASPFALTLIAAPVNGSVGNVPTMELASEAGAMVAPDAADLIVKAAIELLTGLYEAGPAQE